MLEGMSGVRRGPSGSRTRDASAPVDRRIAAIAARQHGVVARTQLRQLGLKETAIARRLEAGRLHPVHRGVYAVGHPLLSRHGRWTAAVLACGRGAVLSHGSAAALWELRPAAGTGIDVTVPGTGRRRRPGVTIHRARGLSAEELDVHRGIPVTTPARTVLDLAATLAPRALEHLLDQAEILGLADEPALRTVAAAHAGHRGSAKLRGVLDEHVAGTTLTKSELEERMLGLCIARGLPRPRVNHRAAGLEVDFLFADDRVVVETDSWRFHRTRSAFERDRERDAILARAGFRVLRFTHRQLVNEPETAARTLAAALAPRS
jgi:REase_MTES_1575/Transcriptional regulator, AbiEi antitoxin